MAGTLKQISNVSLAKENVSNHSNPQEKPREKDGRDFMNWPRY